MAFYTSKNQICNLALAKLGDNRTVSDIETPVTDVEIAFSLQYDIIRQSVLRKIKPQFATKRRFIAKEGERTGLGYPNYYEYPQDCLRILGIGEISEKENDYVIEADESGNVKIWTDTDATEGLPIRFIYDAKLVSNFTPDFCDVFATVLAGAVALKVTQNVEAAQLAINNAAAAMASSNAINAQESRPVRVSNSRFLMSRLADITSLPQKR